FLSFPPNWRAALPLLFRSAACTAPLARLATSAIPRQFEPASRPDAARETAHRATSRALHRAAQPHTRNSRRLPAQHAFRAGLVRRRADAPHAAARPHVSPTPPILPA